MILRRLPAIIAIWLATALTVLLCSWLLSSVSVTNFGAALVAALVIGLANALLWPLLIRLTLPLTVITLGLGALVLNGAIVLLAAAITPGLNVSSLGGGIASALIITAVTTLASSMFFIDDDARVGAISCAARRGAQSREPHAGARWTARCTSTRASAGNGQEIPEISVMASGCLGPITFPGMPGRATYAQIAERYPSLIDARRNHPGIGLVLVDGVVYSARGTRNVRDGEEAEGEDPLAPFGPNTAQHVKRTDGFAHCPEIVVNSTWWPETEEVAAFEELVGSHGGLGGPQAYPFVLAPAKLPQPNGPVVGAETMHRILWGWLAHLGQDAYR